MRIVTLFSIQTASRPCGIEHDRRQLLRYLAADWVPVSNMTQRCHLRSTAGHQLVTSSYCMNSCGLQAFSVLGPRLCNSLPRLLRDTGHNITSFGHSLDIFSVRVYSTLGALAIMCYTNPRFAYLVMTDDNNIYCMTMTWRWQTTIAN